MVEMSNEAREAQREYRRAWYKKNARQRSSRSRQNTRKRTRVKN